MNWKENYLRTICFEKPDFIPMRFSINAAYYNSCDRDALNELCERHPFLFPNGSPLKHWDGQYMPVARADEPYTDSFGCVWTTALNGLTGSVHGHPLDTWDKYADYKMPDPDTCTGLYPIDWKRFEENCKASKAAGNFVMGSLRHGHTFLQLCDLRGYDQILYDMMDEEPLLDDLIARLEEFNLAQIGHFLKADVDMVAIPEDLGMQVGPMLSVSNFMRYIQPSYTRMIAPVKKAGKFVHMHSDGDIRLLVDGIAQSGVDVINLQDLVNGIDWIKEKFRGRMCVELDIDRQKITPFGTPDDIDRLVRSEVEAIGTKEGGLMMVYGLYPGVPLENAAAMMDAMERYAGYYR